MEATASLHGEARTYGIYAKRPHSKEQIKKGWPKFDERMAIEKEETLLQWQKDHLIHEAHLNRKRRVDDKSVYKTHNPLLG